MRLFLTYLFFLVHVKSPENMENPTTGQKKSDYVLLRQQDPFGELFSEIRFQS